MTKNWHMELVAGYWIAAKTSRLYAKDGIDEIWAAFANEAERTQLKFGMTSQEFQNELVETAARLYSHQLKAEIFGYEKVGA